MRFRRRRGGDAGVTTAARPISDTLADAERLVSAGQHRDAIDLLNRANRVERDLRLEREVRRIRHVAGIALVARPPTAPRFPDPAPEPLPVDPRSRLPELTPDELTPAVLRGAILRHGALLVRGLMEGPAAERLAQDIDRAFELRAALAPGGADELGYYDELEPLEPHRIVERKWVEVGGGVLAVDSPRLLFDMLEAFEAAGLREVIEGYLGEPPAISAQKCTLRKAMPDVAGAWHQDGRFLGEVRSLNVWLSLSHCGTESPSLDVVPRRLDHLVATETEGTVLSYQVSQAIAEEAAGELGTVRPTFEPGDALLFDDLFLHQTGSDPSMPAPRFSIESWFFGPSAYPSKYTPLAF